MGLRIEYGVTMADGREHKIVADSRDWAKMEVQEFPDSANMTKARFLAWSSMTRHGLTKATFQRFNEEDCVDVVDVRPDEPEVDPAADSGDSEGEQRLDPGRPSLNGESA